MIVDPHRDSYTTLRAPLMIANFLRQRRKRRERRDRVGRTNSSHLRTLTPLEPRLLLAADLGVATPIIIRAAGQTGQENVSLKLDGQEVARWTNVGGDANERQFETLTYVAPAGREFNTVEVAFTNDLFQPGVIDRNLFVDQIQIGDDVLQTESPGVRSSGTWQDGIGFVPGFYQTETLHGNGEFQYQRPTTTIIVDAAGQTGSEAMSLLVDGQTVGRWENIGGDINSRNFQIFEAEVNGIISADRVRVAFTNDLFVPGVTDRNLVVDQIRIDNVSYQSEAATTYSTGTWNPLNNAAVPGRFQSEYLQSNGFFAFDISDTIVPVSPGEGVGSSLTVRGKGDTGLESFDVWVDLDFIGSFDVGTSYQSFNIQLDRFVAADQIRIEYNTDDRGFANGVDANLSIDWIEVDGQRFETEADSTYSSGTGFLAGNVLFGFGNGETLFVNGFFQYQAFAINSDSFSIAEDSPFVPLAVFSNDINADGYFGNVFLTSDPVNGDVFISNNELWYRPDAEFVGTESFTYNIASVSGSQLLVPATITITVNESFQQPQSQINPAVARELTPSGRALVVEKWAKLPLGENGRQPRMNSMTTWGDRIFIVTDGSVEGEGRIYEIIPDGNAASAELFFDAGTAITNASGLSIDNSSPLNGLRSLAFHPEFASNGKLYTSFTGQRPADPSSFVYLSDPVNPVPVESVLVEWTFDFANGQVDPSSYREVFRVGMRNSEHSIRDLRFNPYANLGDEDYGLLYIGHGDGSEQSAVSGDGQDNDALGKILRVDPLASGGRSYTTPSSNPFVNDPSMIDESFAIGFRNPHNLSFAVDANGTAQLIVAEIGRDNVEEINIVTKGANYGWADREGVFVHERDQFAINGNISNLPSDDAINEFTYPVTFFGHQGGPGETFVGQAIAGGMVIQNGSSELDDQIVFVEFGTDARAYHVDFSDALSQVTSLDADDPQRDDPNDLTWLTPQELVILFDHDNDDSTTPLIRDSLKDVLDDEPDFEQVPSAGSLRADLRLGQGPDGELYVMNKRNGWLYRVSNTVV